VYEQALVELEGGRIYVTARLRLARHMRDIRLWVRGGDGVYAPAQTQVMMEDAAADTADYRFALPAVDTYVSWEMYVIPMGREVKFYMNLAPDLTPGGGDFVVSVKPEPPAAESRQGEGAAEPDEPDESAEPEDWAVPATAGPEPSLAELAPEADEPAPPAEAGTEAAALEPPADPETEPPAETAPPAAGSMPAEEGSPPESGGGKNEAAGASPALIVPAVLAAAALSAALSMKRRRKTPR
jgi:hypothetical protein